MPPPARPYQGQPAGLVTRFAAAVIDFLVAFAITLALYLGAIGCRFILHPRTFHWPQDATWGMPLVGAVVAVLYLAAGWSTSGRTIGGSMFGLRVVSAREHRLGGVRATLRAMLYVLFPLGLFWVVVSRHNRSVQDLVLRTEVAYDWSTRPDWSHRPAH
ncbi:MAG TPA: RDD family protein [Mycobacteriales bacterium]|nr:RDD family protein [Mycobacteriales bacterium]